MNRIFHARIHFAMYMLVILLTMCVGWAFWNKAGEFKEDGTLSGVMENKVSFTGKWSANPDDRSISITQLKPASSALKGRNQEFIRSLETARFYKGNSQWIQLAPEARTTYVQLTHIKP